MKQKREQMIRLVSEWRESGLSQLEFCKLNSISLGKFSYWVAQTKPTEASGFISVKPGNASLCDLEIHYPNGVMIKVSNPDLSVISGLIRLG
jgi:primosomal replication protein N